jgi:DNA-binding NarL/FixJ family response regulator
MRVVIAEDSTLFREGLASLLTVAGRDIVGRTGDAVALTDVVASTDPDVAIIDIRMPPDLTDDGARAARVLRAANPRIGILLLSQHIETRHSVELVATGGFGYLLKDRVLEVDEFLDALTRVAAGGPHSIRKSSPGSSAGRIATTHWPVSPHGNGKCSP